MKRMAIALVALVGLMVALTGSAGAQQIQSGSFVSDQGGIASQDPPFQTLANILANPGFETGSLAPWTTDGWTVINSDQYAGTYSAEGVTNISIRQDITPTDVADINSITVWEKQPSGIAFAAVHFIYSSESDYDQFLVAPGAEWTFIDMTTQLRGSGILTGIRFYSYSGPGDQITRIDDVAIDTSGPVPTQVSSWGAIKGLYR